MTFTDGLHVGIRLALSSPDQARELAQAIEDQGVYRRRLRRNELRERLLAQRWEEKAQLAYVKRVMKVTAGEYLLPLSYVLRSRSPIPTEARHVAIYVVHHQTDMTKTAIARAFDRDHSTVIAALAKMDLRLEVNTALRAIVADVTALAAPAKPATRALVIRRTA